MICHVKAAGKQLLCYVDVNSTCMGSFSVLIWCYQFLQSLEYCLALEDARYLQGIGNEHEVLY